ncbi:PREDICTED: transmembrane protein 131-like isoform X1 [Poecilia mexicana]|uniref:transmembrane protein 131-like isoform X1 n=2 Tax=Poecilia mexicana TaxID=48701 RepID=UPI00072E0EA8|nr:PREDICTED: transmembrane protein 131-like isoform X1 [Poecilia mexicana]
MHFFTLLTFLNDVLFCFYLQVVEERRRDGLPLEDDSSPYTQENGMPLHIQPPVLDFGTQPLGLPRAETIYIHNPSQEVPVTLLSMFPSSRQFYIPSFHRRVIPPKGKASFKLIFLPSEEGSVENTLFINTSAHGLLSYQVFGVGSHQTSLKSSQRKKTHLMFPHIQSIKLTQTQEDASNITILGLLLECSLPKSLLNSPQVLLVFSACQCYFAFSKPMSHNSGKLYIKILF